MMGGNGDITSQTDYTPECKYFSDRSNMEQIFSNINYD